MWLHLSHSYTATLVRKNNEIVAPQRDLLKKHTHTHTYKYIYIYIYICIEFAEFDMWGLLLLFVLGHNTNSLRLNHD